jgi:hypothetical protein
MNKLLGDASDNEWDMNDYEWEPRTMQLQKGACASLKPNHRLSRSQQRTEGDLAPHAATGKRDTGSGDHKGRKSTITCIVSATAGARALRATLRVTSPQTSWRQSFCTDISFL